MGTLYIVATPIGNLEDITVRAIKTLFSVDYIACEDTRRSGQLLQNLESGIMNHEFDINILKKPRLISYYDEVEAVKTPEIIDILENGNDVALVSDAGTPLISDPGYKLVRECAKRDIKVVSIPGATPVISALVSSGLPANQFLFMGFLPKNKNKRIELLKDTLYCFDTLESMRPTVIFFETVKRLEESLLDIKEIFGDMEIVIARELTKMHEEIWRGKISAAIKREFKGEIVVLFHLRS